MHVAQIRLSFDHQGSSMEPEMDGPALPEGNAGPRNSHLLRLGRGTLTVKGRKVNQYRFIPGRILGPGGRVSPRDSGGDHDKYCGHDYCNEPAHPVDSRAAISSEGCIDEPPDEDAPNSAENGEPKGGVVSAAWRDKLTQQPDDDACDDHSDYFHGICLSVGQPRLRSQL